MAVRRAPLLQYVQPIALNRPAQGAYAVLAPRATPALINDSVGVDLTINSTVPLIRDINLLGVAIHNNRDRINKYNLIINNFVNIFNSKIHFIHLLIDQISAYIAALPNPLPNPNRINELERQRAELITLINEAGAFIRSQTRINNRSNLGLDPIPLRARLEDFQNNMDAIVTKLQQLTSGNNPGGLVGVPVAVPIIPNIIGGSRFKESKKTRKNKRIKRRKIKKSKRSKSLQKGGYLYGSRSRGRGYKSKSRTNKSQSSHKNNYYNN